MSTIEQTTTVTTGTVVGTVTSSPKLANYTGTQIALVDRRTARPVGTLNAPPVARDGTFRIRHVPVGRWGLLCMPPFNLPIANVTFPALVGLDLIHGSAIHVTAGSTKRVHLTLPSAGYIQVFVTAADTGQPLPGAVVLSYETSTRQGFATEPATTDASGQVLLSNMPLRSSVVVLGPSGYGTSDVIGPDGTSLLTISSRGSLVTLQVSVNPQ